MPQYAGAGRAAHDRGAWLRACTAPAVAAPRSLPFGKGGYRAFLLGSSWASSLRGSSEADRGPLSCPSGTRFVKGETTWQEVLSHGLRVAQALQIYLQTRFRRVRRLAEPGNRDQHKITGDFPGDDPHRAIGRGESCIHSSVANAPAAMSIQAAWKLSHIYGSGFELEHVTRFDGGSHLSPH
jgi:hypothetical protein